MTHIFAGVLALVALTAAPSTRSHPTLSLSLRAGQTADHSTLSGTWNMSLNGGDHVVPVGLVLEQDGKTLTGTLMIMGKDVPLEGEYVDGALKLSGNAQIGTGDGHSLGPLKITGTLKDDGTLAGEFESPHGPLSWTAERLKKRK